MKPIQPNETTTKALLVGASGFLMEIENQSVPKMLVSFGAGGEKEYIRNHLPLQIGNEFYLQEEFSIEYEDLNKDYPVPELDIVEHVLHKSDYDFTQPYLNPLFPSSDMLLDSIDWQPASKMTQEQSRYKGKVTDIKIARIQDISIKQLLKLGFKDTGSYIYYGNEELDVPDWFNNQFNSKYEDNPYVAYIECKEIAWMT